MGEGTIGFHSFISIMDIRIVLADALVVIHFAYVLFVAGGMIAILLGILRHWSWVRNFWFRAIHLLLIGIVVVETFLNIECPLTDWEDSLREAAGVTVEKGTFIGRWVHALMFFNAPWLWPIVYSLFGLAVLLAFIFAPPRRPWSSHKIKN
jgi:hypothetical protein